MAVAHDLIHCLVDSDGVEVSRCHVLCGPCCVGWGLGTFELTDAPTSTTGETYRMCYIGAGKSEIDGSRLSRRSDSPNERPVLEAALCRAIMCPARISRDLTAMSGLFQATNCHQRSRGVTIHAVLPFLPISMLLLSPFRRHVICQVTDALTNWAATHRHWNCRDTRE